MHFKKIILAAVLATTTPQVSASFISGQHFLSNGQTVELQGLEWMPLSYTAGLSRYDVEDGFTDRFGTSWSATDWRYATRQETETLLGSLWDQQFSGWSHGNAEGAQWFIDFFDGIDYDTGFGQQRSNGFYSVPAWMNMDHSMFYFGADGECTSSLTASCQGEVAAALNYDGVLMATDVSTNQLVDSYFNNNGPLGMFSDYRGVNMSNSPHNDWMSKSFTQSQIGSLLVRKAVTNPPRVDVPSPPMLSIVALALICLLGHRHRCLQN